jgi:hypothetical protein
MSTRRDGTRRGTGRKKPYKAPKLTVHGDIRTLTRTKAGTKSDGASKPATKASGSQA